MNDEHEYTPEIKGITSPVFWNKVGRNKTGRGSRLELKNGCLSIGKICFGLQEFDENNRQVNYISCYVDSDKAVAFSHAILSGTFDKSPDNMSVIKEFPGGQPADRAGRDDHKPLYRCLSLSKGRMWIISALEGPGKITETGGFAPDGKFEKKVAVGMSDEELMTMAVMIDKEYSAYRTAQYLRR